MMSGRGDRLAVFRERLERARAGQGGTIVAHGPAGCGRTWLCEHLASTGSPWVVSYGRPPHVDTSGWLEAAASASRTRPLLFVVDDADALDVRTRDEVVSLAELAPSRPVVVVLSARRTGVLSLDPRSHQWIEVPPLDLDELTALMRVTTGVDPGPVALRRVAALSRGNARTAAEMARALGTRAVRTGEDIDETVLGRLAYTRSTADAMRALPDATRLALCTAAIGRTETTATVANALERLRIGVGDLAPAERYQWIEVDDTRITFLHPLDHVAATMTVPFAQRRLIADALAGAAAEQDPLRAAWYEAYEHLGSDDDLAAHLDRLARHAIDDGDPGFASEVWRRAADLATTDAAHLRLAAADAAQWAGRLDDAAELAAAVLDADVTPADVTPADRAEARRIVGLVATWRGRPDSAWSAMADAAEQLPPERRLDAAALLLQATVAALHVGRLDVAVHLTTRARELAVGLGPLEIAANAAAGYARALVGDAGGVAAVRTATDLHHAVAPIAAANPAVLHLTSWVGRMLDECGDGPGAAAMLGWTIDTARSIGADGMELMPRLHRASARMRRGALADATEDVLVAAELADRFGQDEHRHTLDAAAGRLASLRGEVEGIARLRDASDHSTGPVRLEALVSLGRAALSLGRAEEATRALMRADELSRSVGIAHPGFVPYHADLVESLLRTNAVDDAVGQARSLARAADDWPDPLVQGLSQRALGVTSVDDDVAEQHFRRSVELLTAADAPIESARTELCRGVRLRRRRRRAAARPPLRRAATTFRELGVLGWASLADAELAAVDATARRARDSTGLGALSPRELQVALAVAEGGTNREVASMLHLSPKTVENQLSRIYALLGVRSRTELARVVHEAHPADQR